MYLKIGNNMQCRLCYSECLGNQTENFQISTIIRVIVISLTYSQILCSKRLAMISVISRNEATRLISDRG